MNGRRIFTVEVDLNSPQSKKYHTMYVLGDTGGSGGGDRPSPVGELVTWGDIKGDIGITTALLIEEATKDITAILSNKTINALYNTISNLETEDFKSSALALSSNNVRTYDNSVDTKVVTEKFLQKTLHNIELPEEDKDAANKKYVDDLITELNGKILKFKGFVSTTAPTGSIKKGSLWYESNILPSIFPINVKTYNKTTNQWSTTTSQYTPESLDLWANLNDDKGYYWFGNGWNMIDDNGRFLYVSTFTGVIGNPAVLYYLDTAYSTYEKGFYRFIPASGGNPAKFVLLNKELFKYVSTFTGVIGDVDKLYFLDTEYDSYKVGFYRFIEAQGSEPAKFIRINPSPIKYVSTFNGVVGNIEDLYYLDTEYDNYEVGFYRFMEATTTEPLKFVLLNKQRFKYVSTFTGEIGDINRLYYLDTTYDNFKKGFYRYNGITFVNINPKQFFYVNTFTGIEGDDESLYYLDTAYNTYKVGFYRFIPAVGAEPAKFVLIGRPLVKYVSTFNNVVGDTDVLYYLDTKYGDYKIGFYRYIEAQGATPVKFMLIGSASEVFTDVDVLPDSDIDTHSLYRITTDYYQDGNTDYTAIEAYQILSENVSADENALHWDAVDYAWENVTDSVVQELSTISDIQVTTSLIDADFIKLGTHLYDYIGNINVVKAGLYHNSTGLNTDWILVGGGTDVNLDEVTVEEVNNRIQANAVISVNALPTTNIKEKSLYEMTETVSWEEHHYTHNTDPVVEIKSYKLTPTGGQVLEITESDGIWFAQTQTWTPWNELTESTIDYYILINRLMECDFDDADKQFSGYKENAESAWKYDYKTKVTDTPATESFTMTKLFKRRSNQWKSISTIELTSEQYARLTNAQKNDGTVYILDKEESNAIIDVLELPTEDIETQSLYRLNDHAHKEEWHYYHNNVEMEDPPIHYYASNREDCVISENGILTPDSITLTYATLTDTDIATMLNQSVPYIKEVDSLDDAELCCYGEDRYDWHSNFTEEHILIDFYMLKLFGRFNDTWKSHSTFKLTEQQYGALTNAQKNDGSVYIVDSNAEITLDEVTTEFVNNKLQANAAIPVDSLPTTDIKEKSLYEVTENVTISHETYTYDGNPITVIPKSYKSVSPNTTVGESSLDIYMSQWDTTTSYYYKITPGQYWVNPELVEGWISEGLIEEVEFTNNDSTAFCHYGDENFDNGSHFAKEGTSETFSMVKLFRRRNDAWQSISTIKLTDEVYNALTEDQKNDGTVYIVGENAVIIDVNALPTTNIASDILYRLSIKECRRKPTGDVIENPVAYRSKNLEECSYNTDGISFQPSGEESTFYPWDNVEDTIISDWISGGYIEETSLEQGDFFKAASNFYLYKTSVEFTSYYELYHNPTATADAFIKVGGDIDVDNQTIVEVENKLRANTIIDIETLPTTNILKNSIYRKYGEAYMYKGSEIVQPTGYVSADTERVVITATGIDHMEEGTLLNHYDWENVTDSVILTVGNLALATFEDAQMFKIGDNQYDYKTTVTHEQVCELYHNPTGLQNDYKLIGGGGSAEVDEVTTELVSDKVQANAIISVTSLPTTNIKEKSLYQYTENVGYVLDHWTRGDEEIETPQHFYKSTSYYLQVYNGEILYYHEEAGDPDWPYVNNHVEWYRFTDEHLNYFLNKNLIVECTPTDGTFCEYAAGKYDWVNDGTSATMGVKHTSETKNFSMTKLFRRVNGTWESISVIGLTEEQYDNLPASIKNDGTLYIVDDAAELVVEKTYKALADKPVVNGITLNGSLTLEDLGLYSRTEVNALLESKGQVEFVDALPATPTKNTWYYSKKYEDGTDVPDNKRCLYIVDEDTTVFHEMGIVGDIEMETGDTLSGSEHLVTSSQVVKKEMSTKLNKYGTQVNIETAVDDATLWTNLAQIGTDDKKTDSSMVFNAGTCYLIHTVSPTKTAQIFQFIVTGSVDASAINKKITLINPTTNEVFTKAMDGGTWQVWKGGKKYKHTLVRYNNDSFEYTMGWVSIISDKKTMTYNDFRDWLNEKGYTTATNSYYWCGGCCGTTGVRNKEDTGTTYIGRVVSGVFYDGTNMFFKYDYNGTITILESRCKVYTEELN